MTTYPVPNRLPGSIDTTGGIVVYRCKWCHKLRSDKHNQKYVGCKCGSREWTGTGRIGWLEERLWLFKRWLGFCV